MKTTTKHLYKSNTNQVLAKYSPKLRLRMSEQSFPVGVCFCCYTETSESDVKNRLKMLIHPVLLQSLMLKILMYVYILEAMNS